MTGFQRRRWIHNAIVFLHFLIIGCINNSFTPTNAFTINASVKSTPFLPYRCDSAIEATPRSGGSDDEIPSNQKVGSVDSISRRRIILQTTVSLLLAVDVEGAEANTDTNEPLECKNGAIVSESAVPGAYQQVCMSLPTRSITLKSTGDTINIFQGTADDGGGGGASNQGSVAGRTGVALWNSGILLSRLLDSLAQEEHDFFKGKCVLELGCGTALASIVASKLGADNVIATDGNEEVCRLARRNLEHNNIFPENDESSSGVQRGNASYLKWGSLDAVDFYDTADVVIGSDLTYNSGSWGLLAETFDAILKPNGIVIYLTLGHAGFNVAGELGGFLTLVESKGTIEVVKEGSLAWPFPNVSSLEKLLSKSLTAMEREVITGTGGFKAVVLQKKMKRR